jgi:hypothetical protein
MTSRVGPGGSAPPTPGPERAASCSTAAVTKVALGCHDRAQGSGSRGTGATTRAATGHLFGLASRIRGASITAFCRRCWTLRTALQMKRIAYFLISLTLWVHFDDVLLAPASALESAPLPSDDDEYVACEGQGSQKQFGHRRQPPAVSANAQAVHGPLVRTGMPSAWHLTTPFAPPALYVFMSLQI